MPLSICKITKYTALKCFCIVTLASSTALSSMAHAQLDNQAEDMPVSFIADELIYDEQKQLITAIGSVEFEQDGQHVTAKNISYNLQSDVVKAHGNVVLKDENGDVHYADEVELEKDMSEGVVVELKSLLIDGSRFTAENGERREGNKVIMNKATYTPCEICVSPSGVEEEPDWQLKARKVIHNKKEQTIAYEDATFELFGTPVLYTPYFKHADSTVEKKSGFLAPSFSAGSNLGFGVTTKYYWDVAPGIDATVGARVYSAETPLLLGEVRKRFDDASVEFSSGLTYSERNGLGDKQEIRGHLFGEGLWNINEKWRSGFNIEYASDDQYMRQYDITSEDVLENELYVERFDNRDYVSMSVLDFQDLRVIDRVTDQPQILPEIESWFYGDPNAILGGRWSASLSALGLRRDGNGQDSFRTTADLGWEKRHVMDVGLVNTLNLSVRGDLYSTNDLDGNQNTDSREARAFPTAHFETRLPLAKPVRPTTTAIIEPVVSVTARTNINEDNDIPNEDSQDVQIDASNLFDVDRFPGYDRVEDQSHATYGVRAGLYENDGSKFEAFLGQSYRFSNDEEIFPQGSGLETQSSDVVGEVTFDYKKDYSLDYRFQFGSEDFRSKRHELDATASFWRFDVNSSYLYAKALEGTDITENREQLNTTVRTRLNDEWSFTTNALYDLGQDQGLRRSRFGLNYDGQCISIGATMQRNLTEEEAGENSTEFFVRVGLKNLGEFEGGQ